MNQEQPMTAVNLRSQLGGRRGIFLVALACSALLRPSTARAAEPVDSQLPKYNVTWTSASTGITQGMPIGNGSVAALVWAEANKDLMLSVATADSWDENARTIRLGNVRITLTPNPFATGQAFTQVLNYEEGETTFSVGSPAVQIRVWVDANNPVIHVEASGSSAFGMQVTPELWRTTTEDVSNDVMWKDFIHVAKDVSSNTSLLKVVLMPDVMVNSPTMVGWYHRNQTSHWAETMANQGYDVAKYGIKDPLTLRTSGAEIRGTGLTQSGDKLSSTQNQTRFRADIATHTEIAAQVSAWQAALDSVSNAVFATDIEALRTAHQAYWSALWNRSYLFVTGDTDADNVTKGWIAARYLLACQGRGESPIEFNGGLFTFQNDVKLWHDYTQANQQFAHWSLLPSGDFDLIQPWFNMLVAALPVGRARSQAMWKHDGAMFAEHMVLYGPQSGSHYGWDRTGRAPSYELAVSTRLLYGGTMENAVMMLDYYEYTQDAEFATDKLVPFASEIVKWYDLHWPRKNGKINMTPIYSGEKDKNVTNSMVDVAGLTKLLQGLLALPSTITKQADRDYWTTLQAELPALPMSNGRFSPAADLAVGTDTNDQNLAPLFPYRLYGPGKPNLQVAVDSYNARTGQSPRDGTEAWRQDAAHAAYAGLATEAKTHTVARFTKYKYRYIGFVDGSPDGDSCIEPIAIGKIALQAMVMHPGAGKTVNVLNAWPAGWDVQFKLWAPLKTWVSGQTSAGKVTSLTVGPSSRVADVLINGAAPSGVTVTGSNDAGGYVVGGSIGAGGGGPSASGGGAGAGSAGDSSAGGSTSSNGGAGGLSAASGGSADAGSPAAQAGNASFAGGAALGTAGGSSAAAAAASSSPASGCGCRLAAGVSGPVTGRAGWLWAAGALALALNWRRMSPTVRGKRLRSVIWNCNRARATGSANKPPPCRARWRRHSPLPRFCAVSVQCSSSSSKALVLARRRAPRAGIQGS